jgi:hypothetical protein
VTAVPALLAPIRERADKATEGPWEVDRNTPFTSDLVGIFAPARKHYILQVENQDDVDDPTSDEDIKFLAAARTDIPRLLAALDAVLALHKPETRWTHPDWMGSFDTIEEAAGYDEDEVIGDEQKSQVDSFDICAECGRIESEQLSESGEEWGYREGLWPCPTVAAVVAALQEGEQDA